MYKTDEELYLTIGKNIKHYRKTNSITQLQLSELSCVSVSYLTKIEAPNCTKCLSLSVLNNIANALNVDVWVLLKSPDEIQ